MLVVLARATSADEVGLYAWALAVAAPIFILAGLRLQHLQATQRTDKFAPTDYFVQRGASLLGAWIVVCAILMLGRWDADKSILLVVVSLYRTVDSLIEVTNGHLIRHEDMRAVSRVQTCRAIGGLAFFSVGVILTDRAYAGVVALTVISTAILLFILPHAARVGNEALRTPTLTRTWRLTLLAAPLGFAFFIGALTINVPRYVVESELGRVELAVFTAAAYFTVLSNTLVDTVLAATLPRIASFVADRARTAYWMLTLRLCGTGLIVGSLTVILTFVAGERLLDLFYGSEYVMGASALVVLSAAASVQYVSSTLRNSCIAVGFLRAPLAISLLNAGVTIGACVALVKPQGLVGVAAGFFFGQACAAMSYAILFAMTLRAQRW